MKIPWRITKFKIVSTVILCCYGIVFFLSAHAGARIIHVPSDSTTIQSAIHGSADGDTVLVDDGEYGENLDFMGKNILLQSVNGPEVTVVDGNGLGSVVSFHSGEDTTAVISGFTLKGGCGEFGGGIWAYHSSFTSSNNIIVDNQADNFGGGICMFSSVSVVLNTMVDSNSAASGGGIYCADSSDLTVMRSVISNNTSTGSGGGILGGESRCTLHSSRITGNAASASGGGVYFGYCPFVSLMHDTIFGNITAKHGGGIHSSHSVLTAINNVIGQNQATYRGGGVRSDHSADLLSFNVIYGNTGGRGAGVYCEETDIDMQNNIISSNVNGWGLYVNDEASAVVSMYNDLWDNAKGEYGGYAAAGEGDFSRDPLFIDDLSGDFHLDPLSPCIDAGNPDPLCNDRNGSRANVGYCGGPFGGGVWIPPAEGTPNFFRIQRAIEEGDNGDSIFVAPGEYCEDINFNGKRVVLLSQEGPATTVITGSGNGTVVSFDSGEVESTVLDGFTVRHGNAYFGGGICCNGASPVIRNNIIEENRATEGGGVYCKSSNALIADNEIRNNEAENGGGGIYFAWADLNIEGNRITENVAKCGGGLYSYIFSNSVIERNLFCGNRADSTGGAIFTSHSSPLVHHNTMDGNSAEDSGGGISCAWNSCPQVCNNIVVNALSGGGIYCEDPGSDPELNFNCVWGNTGGNYLDCSPGERDITAPPAFLQDPDDYYGLDVRSPCLDGGDPLEEIPVNGGPRIDIGAFEYAYPIDPALSVIFTDVPDSVQAGTSFAFDIQIDNLTEENQIFDGWIEASGPVCRTILSEGNLRINGNRTRPFHLSFPVPSKTPPGIYVLKLRAGTESETIEAGDVHDVVVW
jgi:predicted outer membrane repeat protein